MISLGTILLTLGAFLLVLLIYVVVLLIQRRMIDRQRQADLFDSAMRSKYDRKG